MGKLIALDSMVFIYLFENDERYRDFVEPLFQQIESQKVSACTSMISLIETLSPAKLSGDECVTNELTRFFQETPGLTVHPVSWEVAQEAAKLRRENPHLRTPDSIQIATALVHKAGTFITYDVKLKKLKIPGLVIKILT